ncbi:type I-C CRISPR-associated endonuclease Cas1 [Thermaerobacter sp. FW80]|uniref:type I-C CRISPR-associated endonuclease Cas1c n=1 Tax=Thermaerobacter sp. FW80 TaxID=2546351 RepID=UPI001074FEB8|nr:type I-C CRISPR-associated endonuclease Cas1c [Thermaerobacter sp. FW80]QBS38233.1 type I-C CRISPR-associated endonuclease Cas1 [Thermaerobacter sp. FW80]
MTHVILNTLYVQTQGAYIHLYQDTVRVEVEEEVRLQVPLHHLGGVVVFGNVLVSPYLIQRFAEDGRFIVWFSASGRFVGRLQGPTSGNVLLRRAQHEVLSDPGRTLHLARCIVSGKLKNSRQVLLRGLRDLQGSVPAIEEAADNLQVLVNEVQRASSLDGVRGVEGRGAHIYFTALGHLIRGDFVWTARSRRPPRDPINALLSFAYALLVSDCVAACEGAGLDPQVGYLHALRPGRPSLALDLAEEFRSVLADRLVLSLVNRRQVQPGDFDVRPGGAVVLKDDARRVFLDAYQRRKQEEVTHPLLEQRIPIGLVPYVQARLLARFLRGDTPKYVPYSIR